MVIGEIFIKELNCTLSYDPDNGVLKDGVLTRDFSPVFIGNNDDNDLFGYSPKGDKVVYDIYGGKSNVVSENSITI